MFYKLLKIWQSFSRKERRLLEVALGVFAVASISLSLVWYYQNTDEKPVDGGSYTEGVIGQPIAVNPLISGDNDADRDLITLLFASLYDLAEKYTADTEQKVWNITLKQDLRWSDGSALTSDDVIFTINTVQDPDARSPLFTTWQGVTAERISEREVRLTLKNTYAFFLDNLKSLRVAPKHIFDGIPPQNFRLSEFNLKPVGSGPYKFLNYEKRPDGFIEKYNLTDNQFYSQKKPYIQSFAIRFFATKAEAISAFNVKGIDGLGGLEAKDLENLKISHQVLKPARSRYYAVFLNPNTSLALKEKEVRQALVLATDNTKLVTDFLNDAGSTAYGPIPQSIAGYDASVYAGQEFSIDQANAILDKAGWKMNDRGVREKVIQKSKVPLEFDLVVPEVGFLIDTANALKESWAKIGAKINPAVLKSADIISGIIKPRNYQMLLFGNTLNKTPDIFSFWHSSQKFDPGLNLALFGDKNVDLLLESTRQSLDATTTAQNLSKVQKIIYDFKPAVFLYSPNYLYATSKSLGGFPTDSLAYSSSRFDNAEDWYLKTARVFK